MLSGIPQRWRWLGAAIIALSVLGSGCGKDFEPCVPASVSVAPAEATLTALGADVELDATVRSSGDQVCTGVTLDWSSDRESICTVDNTGTVTAVANGECTVTASVDGLSGSATVTVEQEASHLAFRPQPQDGRAETPLPAFEVCVQDANDADAALDNSTSIALAIGTNPSGGTLTGTSPRTVAGGCANFDDLQIDIEGADYTLVASASAAGLADLTSGTFDVDRNVGEVTASCGTETLASLGEATQCEAEARSPSGRLIPDPDAAGVPLNTSWTTDPTSFCTADGAGMVTAVGNGICTVTATIDGVSGDVDVTVQQAPAGLTVGPPDLGVLDPGEVRAFAVEVVDALGEPIASPTIGSSCADQGVATASETDVTGVSEGVTDCTFTSGTVDDAARVAVVAQKGFAAVATTSPGSYRATVAAGSSLDLELWMIRPTSGDGDLGSVQGELAWDPAVLDFTSSVGVEDGWTWITNETDVDMGRLGFAAFSAEGTAADFVVARITFDVVGASDSNTPMELDVSVAGDALGTDITALMQPVDTRTGIE